MSCLSSKIILDLFLQLTFPSMTYGDWLGYKIPYSELLTYTHTDTRSRTSDVHNYLQSTRTAHDRHFHRKAFDMSCSDSEAIMSNSDCGKVPALILSIFSCECGAPPSFRFRTDVARLQQPSDQKDEVCPLAATHLNLARIPHATHHLSAPDPFAHQFHSCWHSLQASCCDGLVSSKIHVLATQKTTNRAILRN